MRMLVLLAKLLHPLPVGQPNLTIADAAPEAQGVNALPNLVYIHQCPPQQANPMH